MKTKILKKFQIGILCILVTLCVVTVEAQPPRTRYFLETGFNVSGEFLDFWEQQGGLAILGYPLTREFEENGLAVQYFQRVRMEKHPENPIPYKVQLGLLGDQLGFRQPPIPETEIPPYNHADKYYFAETGHTVQFAFLKFFQDNGGVDVFGYPITEWIIESNGRIVQYFQRGKMEWYPENPQGQRVQLGMLGEMYVNLNVDPIYRQPQDPGSAPGTPVPTPTLSPDLELKAGPIQELLVSVTLKHAIIALEGTQVMYVYVRDQNGRGVPGVSVQIEVEYKDGQPTEFVLPPTDVNGYAQFEFSIGSPAPGYVVIINLFARLENLQSTTSTAFLPWW
ncbi:MAG: hypothetical protein JW934_08470 [Anaerolineae bacterium]|nr:hypothetical protein [Anaerolineae bacterium]